MQINAMLPPAEQGQCAKLSYSLIQSDYKQTHMLCSPYYHQLYDQIRLECMNVKEHNVL